MVGGSEDLNRTRSSRRDGNMGPQGPNRDRSRSNHRNSTSFSNLNNDVMEHEFINSNNPENTHLSNIPKTVKRIPPIRVDDLSVLQLQGILRDISYLKKQPHVQQSRDGLIIKIDNISDYEHVYKYLKQKGVLGYTHSLDSKVKCCLYGLHTIEIEELRNELKELVGVLPIHIHVIPIKNRRYTEQNVYVVHFWKSSGVTLQKLRMIKAIFNVIVKWDYYVENKNNPNDPRPKVTQCSNCQGYFHGTEGCFRNPKCRRCSGNHKTTLCKFLKVKDSEGNVTVNTKIPDDKVKCTNCNGKHTANFSGCPYRSQLIKQRTEFRQRTQVAHQNHRSQSPSPRIDTSNFPQLTTKTQQTFNWHNPRQKSSQQNHSMNDLFPHETCNEILNEFINRLSTCRNKIDQIKIIGDLTFKFLFSSQIINE